jgi:hypothetical protein
METTARRCAGCGSPLPDTPDSTRQIKCAFCGLVNDFAHGAPAARPPAITVDVRGAAKAGRTIALLILGITLIVLIAIGAAIYTAMRPVTQVLNSIPTQIPQIEREARAARGPQKIQPPALATADNLGWRELDVPAPKSGWAEFEPVTDLGWAVAIAHAWQKDARLMRIDVDRLKESGTIDLTAGPENSAGYRFTSPSQLEAWARIADRDARASVPYELMIKLAESKVTALVVRGQPPSRELPKGDVDSYPLPELLPLAKKSPGFTAHPFYNGYMVYLPREGWVWYLNSLSGRDSIPRVRARDGAAYPYPR